MGKSGKSGTDKIENAYECVAKVYEEIKEKANLTVCLYHGGMECDIDTEEILEKTRRK